MSKTSSVEASQIEILKRDHRVQELTEELKQAEEHVTASAAALEEETLMRKAESEHATKELEKVSLELADVKRSMQVSVSSNQVTAQKQEEDLTRLRSIVKNQVWKPLCALNLL